MVWKKIYNGIVTNLLPARTGINLPLSCAMFASIWPSSVSLKDFPNNFSTALHPFRTGLSGQFPISSTPTSQRLSVISHFRDWHRSTFSGSTKISEMETLGSHLCLYLSDQCKSPIHPGRVPYKDFQTQSLGQKEKSTRSENMKADKPIALQIDARSPWAMTLRNAEVDKRY